MSKKHTYEEVKDYIEVESKSGCTLVSPEYKNIDAKIEIMDKNNHVFKTSFYYFKKGKQCCNICTNAKISAARRNNISEVYAMVDALHLEFVEWIEEYVNQYSKFKVQCNKGHIFKTHFSSLKHNNNLCPRCAHNAKLDIDYCCKNFVKRGYSLLENEYINAYYKMKYLCHKHPNQIQYINWHDFNSGRGCPICRESKGERKIREYLTNENIVFKSQFCFDDCKNKKSLPFDFAIFNNNQIKCLIEYDGEQHYKVLRYSKNIDKMNEKLKTIQYCDELKNEYCKLNNIKLIRIPYFDFKNIENILDKENL